MKRMARPVPNKKNLNDTLFNQALQSCQDDDNHVPADFFELLDKFYQANLAKLSFGISPAAIATSYYSWTAQLLQAPGTFLKLSLYPFLNTPKYLESINQELPANGEDVRFQSNNWSVYPWRWWAENFLHLEDWGLKASKDIPGLPVPVQRILFFRMRQFFDALSPSNFVLSNPDLFQETLRSQGKNLIHGSKLALQDFIEKVTGKQPADMERFIPGKQVAITPGKVVFKNHLIELIQYQAQTPKVYAEPLLILPAWIMKYYILDLLPHNSLVNWLVQQGHTVFMVSWRNPKSSDRNLSFDDYYQQGALAAIDAISAIFPKSPMHLMGYCLGGTLAMITAAALAANKDRRLKSLSLLAAQGDFTDAGELLLFINKSEVSFLKSMMWDQGYLDTKQMAGTFQMLRSYDLIWSKMVQDYMHDTPRGVYALLAWNADATRMPYKMHSDYLEKLFLNNDFAEGRFCIAGTHVVPENIQLPAFVVSTEKDHVAPWKSVFKTHLMINGDITFVLTNGGHNAGIVSEPGHKGRRYLIHEHNEGSPYLDPIRWLEQATAKKDSWWLAWHQWLTKQSSVKKIKAPTLNPKLKEAPGQYVLQK